MARTKATEAGPETRTRETVEAELERAVQSRDGMARELADVRQKLQSGRADEAAAVSEAVRSGKAPEDGGDIERILTRERVLERQLTAAGHALQRLEAERDELDLAELKDEARRAGEYALETLEKSRRAAEENRRATARAEQLREQVHEKRQAVRRPRATPQPQTSAAVPDADRKFTPQVRGLNG